MRKITLIACIVALGTFLTGCKNAPEISVINKSKKIGFISLLRDEFHSVYVGTTVFTNKASFTKTPGWGMSRTADNFVVSQLKSNRRFQTRKARYSKPKLQKILLDSLGPFSSTGGFKTELNRIAGQQGFDTLVVLAPRTVDQVMFRSSKVGEYGMYQRYDPFFKDSLCTYVKYELLVYSLDKKDYVGTRFTFSNSYHQSVSLCDKNAPAQKSGLLSEGYTFKEKLSEYSAAQKSEMKRKIKAQFLSNLRTDLECLKLKTLKNGSYRKEGCSLFD